MSTEQKILTAEESQRLDLILVQQWPELGRRALRELVQQGGVRINGELALKAGQYVQAGERVEVAVPPLEESLSASEVAPSGLDVVYEDASIVVADKPAGMPTNATRHGGEVTLATLLGQAYPDLWHVGGLSLIHI